MIAFSAAGSSGRASSAKLLEGLYYPQWRRGPYRTPPIDPFPHHRQLRRGQAGHSIGRRRPWEAAPLEHLVVQAEALAVPVEQLDPVAAAATKGKNGARARVVVQHL